MKLHIRVELSRDERAAMVRRRLSLRPAIQVKHIARACGIAPNTLWHWEKGERYPSWTHYAVWRSALKMPPMIAHPLDADGDPQWPIALR